MLNELACGTARSDTISGASILAPDHIHPQVSTFCLRGVALFVHGRLYSPTTYAHLTGSVPRNVPRTDQRRQRAGQALALLARSARAALACKSPHPSVSPHIPGIGILAGGPHKTVDHLVDSCVQAHVHVVSGLGVGVYCVQAHVRVVSGQAESPAGAATRADGRRTRIRHVVAQAAQSCLVLPPHPRAALLSLAADGDGALGRGR